MTCPRCQIEYNSLHWGECPHCGTLGEPSPHVEGVIKTSTILISTDDGGVFGSIDEVPEPLREALVSATTGANSATIFIADRVGRSRIAAALRSLPVNPGTGPSSSLSLRQPAGTRLRAKMHVLIGAGLLAAGLSGGLIWFALSHLH
jgi:hypothetical protein